MTNTVDLNRNVPRLGLNRLEVAQAIGVSANTVDVMVDEGFLPKPRKWHSRKVWLVAEIVTAMASWPEEGMQAAGEADGEDWSMSA
ncbi:hypothetical protein [Aliirhizobium cellulosilyticum]|uniref:Putative DNA-binding transcriptional regulator AlpA n=1 Tax=Aliirhizobium cellulosilyticum TaxID=393664 RepID=A0A7W6X8E1_9HYPH|nr:hypothetical protein [Rhizobium cellulosilyticum]MBB4348005.1 putative DNA-binding transcriptional regulator AlpA [Rhizobium cellulosilyticum]MBB4409601.1 putative DNA-binding transcriptional regulator AlpA [Rhizobium cellulosilyticum]MBB4444289.1 putative DNA-binding transcriptional regulator AlpA [Rhizobium cellulosilyticum]